MCYALILRKYDLRLVEEQPQEVRESLTKYEDIIYDNLLDGLSPIRCICHYMDMIFGVSLPKKLAHYMTLAENEEFYRKVKKILKKSIIRESLSPCAIPLCGFHTINPLQMGITSFRSKFRWQIDFRNNSRILQAF